MKKVGLRDRPSLRIHLLAKEVDVGVGVDRRTQDFAVTPPPDGDAFLRDHQHPARAAARVVDRADHSVAPDAVLVPGEHQIDHQMHDVARREVLARVLVQRFVEPADQLFENRPHRRVVDVVRVQIDILEALQHLEQQPRLIEPADCVVEVEALNDLAHVLAEAGDVIAKIGCDVRRVADQLVEIVQRGVVERETGGHAELLVEVLQPSVSQLGLPREHLSLGTGQHAVETAQHGQRQDDVLVPAAPEGVANEVGDPPQKTDDLAMVHRATTFGLYLFNLQIISRTLASIASTSARNCSLASTG
jgi:hypothetical protein